MEASHGYPLPDSAESLDRGSVSGMSGSTPVSFTWNSFACPESPQQIVGYYLECLGRDGLR
jgi:hypothetical protein